MIKYSHVRLMILCDEAGYDEVKLHLPVKPSNSKIESEPPPTGLTHTWILDSPCDETQGDPTTRLESLADAIEPFASDLIALDKRWRRFIDIVYHVTPQHVGGISGEFDWFRCPAGLMRRISGWNLDVSYEMFWFDHPDWKRLKYPWWQRWLKRRASE